MRIISSWLLIKFSLEFFGQPLKGFFHNDFRCNQFHRCLFLQRVEVFEIDKLLHNNEVPLNRRMIINICWHYIFEMQIEN